MFKVRHIVIVSLSLSSFLFYAPAFCVPENDIRLQNLEEKFFHRVYRWKPVNERLARIEKAVFGEVRKGDDETRLSALTDSTQKSQGGNDILNTWKTLDSKEFAKPVPTWEELRNASPYTGESKSLDRNYEIRGTKDYYPSAYSRPFPVSNKTKKKPTPRNQNVKVSNTKERKPESRKTPVVLPPKPIRL